jgi:hypothetical protein
MIAESAYQGDKTPYALELKAQYQKSRGTLMANIPPPAIWTPPPIPPTLATSTPSHAPSLYSIEETRESLKKDELVADPELNIPPPAMWTPPPISPSLATKETQKSPKKDELVAAPESNIPPAMWTPPPIPPSLADLTPSDALQEDKTDNEQNIPPKSTKKDELLAASESSTALLQPSTAPSPHDETPPATLVSSTLAASTASDAGPLDSTQENPFMQKDNPDSPDNLPDQSSKNDFSTAESSTAPLPPSDLFPSSRVSPLLAASTTLALDSSQENVDVKGNQPDTEQESDVGASATKPHLNCPLLHQFLLH